MNSRITLNLNINDFDIFCLQSPGIAAPTPLLYVINSTGCILTLLHDKKLGSKCLFSWQCVFVAHVCNRTHQQEGSGSVVIRWILQVGVDDESLGGGFAFL